MEPRNYCMVKRFRYSDQKIGRITLEVEKITEQQIQDAEKIGGHVRLDVILMTGWLRLCFTIGMRDYIHKETGVASGEQAVQVTVGDAYSVNAEKAGEVEYYLDYKYSPEFSVVEYLMETRRA